MNRSRRLFARYVLGAGAYLAFEPFTFSYARDARANEERVDEVVRRSHELLDELHAPGLLPFLDSWPIGLPRRRIVASALPVLRWLPEIQKAAPEFSTRLISSLHAAAPLLSWRRSYTVSEVGAHFLENYGWTELVGLTGPLASEQLACGVLLLGPHVTYPRHRHEAEEIYVPLVGTASWLGGDQQWRQLPPATVIHHAPPESHAMRTGSAPLLALYLWRSANLAQKSQLDPHPEPQPL